MKRFVKVVGSSILILTSLIALISVSSCKGTGTTGGVTKKYAVTITQPKDQTLDGKIEAKVNNVAIGAEVAEGAIVTLSYTAGSKNTFKSWKVLKKGSNDPVTLKPDSNTEPATFTMPAYDVAVSVEVQDKASVPKHKVIIEELVSPAAYGSFEVKVGNTKIKNEDDVAEGETVTLTYTPGTQSTFDEWYVTKRSESTEVPLNPGKKTSKVSFKMPKYDVEIRAYVDAKENIGKRHEIKVVQPQNQNDDGKIEIELLRLGTTDKWQKLVGNTIGANRSMRCIYKKGSKKKLLKWWVVKKDSNPEAEVAGTQNTTSPTLVFSMPDFPITVSVKLQEIKKYEVTIKDIKPEEGKVTVKVDDKVITSGTKVEEGKKVNILYERGTDPKKYLAQWKVVKKGTQNKVDLLYGGNEKNEFTMPDYEVEIIAEIGARP